MTDTTKRPTTIRIPDFKTRAEEAEFWDTHDTTEFEDEFKPVRATFAKNLSEGITIRFDPQTLGQLREQAAEKGIGATSLIRMWVLERLREASPTKR